MLVNHSPSIVQNAILNRDVRVALIRFSIKETGNSMVILGYLIM